MKNAYPADELMPLTCKGRTRGRTPSRGDVDDALGNFQLTLVDALGSFESSRIRFEAGLPGIQKIV